MVTGVRSVSMFKDISGEVNYSKYAVFKHSSLEWGCKNNLAEHGLL